MDRASSLIFPGSRTLAGWWRALSSYQPSALAVGYGFLHRVEAPVNVQLEQSIDPLAHLVLQAFALDEGTSVHVADLQQRLRLPTAIVQRILAGMLTDGLIARSPPDSWQTTERGNHALQHRSFPMRAQQRRIFPFLENMDSLGKRLGPPRFVPLAECVGAAWQVDDAHRFDIATLQDCVEQADEWKQAKAFPLDVESVAAHSTLEAWQHVIVDRPERVLLVLLLVSKEVLGFAVKVDDWGLIDQAPVLRMPAPVDSVWPELTQPPSMHVLQEAWRSWCKQRQLPTNEVEICSLNYHSPRLEVQAPNRMVQRLQAAKSDLFKGDTWLLVGDGHLRTAVQLAIAAGSK